MSDKTLKHRQRKRAIRGLQGHWVWMEKTMQTDVPGSSQAAPEEKPKAA